jgi:hypothetical protein
MDQENASVYRKIAMTLKSTLIITHVNAFILVKLVREINKIQIQVSGTMFMENACAFQTLFRIQMDVMTSRLSLMA